MLCSNIRLSCLGCIGRKTCLIRGMTDDDSDGDGKLELNC